MAFTEPFETPQVSRAQATLIKNAIRAMQKAAGREDWHTVKIFAALLADYTKNVRS